MKKVFPYLLSVFLLFVTFRSSAQYGTVVRVAGFARTQYQAQFTGDGSLATDSSVIFYNPGGICIDTAGNIFIYDGSNARIRKINHTTGLLSTIAGTGIAGFSGDGGPAPLAEISASPYGPICADQAGNIYIVDAGNYRIRKIDHSTGYISTVAGNGVDSFSRDGVLATSTGMWPIAVYVDAQRNIYIAGDLRIRKVNAATGIITTIAGTGTLVPVINGPALNSGIFQIEDIKGDAAGNIYFTDAENSRIEKIDTAGNVVTIVGGIGTGIGFGYGGDGGPAVNANLAWPQGLDLDSLGNIYFCDQGKCIRKVDANTNIIHTVSGHVAYQDTLNSAGYNINNDTYSRNADSISMHPLYIKIDRSGAIVYSDQNGMISKIVGAESAINTLNIRSSRTPTPTNCFGADIPICSVPATVSLDLTGTINGIPLATDSVDIAIDYKEFAVNSIRHYRIPYWHTATYGFGNISNILSTYTYKTPGLYTPIISLFTIGGYSDMTIDTPIIVTSNCDLTGNVTNLVVSDSIVSLPCIQPAIVRFITTGNVDGTVSASDSMIVLYQYNSGDTMHDTHVVPYRVSGNIHSFRDTIYYTVTSSYINPKIRAVTMAGSYAESPDGMLAMEIDTCFSGNVILYLYDTAKYTNYCSLPFVNGVNIHGTLNGFADTASEISIYVNFGDGTDTTFSAPVLTDGRDNFFYGADSIQFNNAIALYHTYNQPGSYPISVTDSAGGFTNSQATSARTITSGCTPISGTFYIDANQNCVNDPGEVVLAYWPYALIDSTTSDTTYGWCDNYGNYTLYLTAGDQYILIANPDGYFGTNGVADSLHASCPSTGIYSFTATGNTNQNFGFVCTAPSLLDMSVSGWGWGYVPGETGYVSIWSSSPTGYICDSLYATITLTLDPLLTYAGMWDGPAPTTISGNILTWTFATNNNLFDMDAHVMVITDTNAQMGAQACNTLSITPSQLTDPDTTNNTYTWCLPIKSSWDPNEKQVSPQGSGTNGYIPLNTPLSYIIHFQNTGTAPASNITIRDTIDQHMDMATVQITSSSAAVLMYQDPGNVLKFRFNNINLPDSMDSPEGSIGFAAYNISPKHGLKAGTKVTNNAGIYFDYNPAVITNTTVNTYQDLGFINGPAFLCIGAGIQLSDTSAGGTWSTNNSNGSISSTGMLSGVKPGYVTVSYSIPGIGATTKTISIRPMPSAGTITGSTNVCIDSTIILSDTAQNGTWTSSNYNANVNYGYLYGQYAGLDTITYTVTNSCATRSTSKVITVGDPGLCSSGVYSINNNYGLQLFPNPASTEVTIKTGKQTYQSFSITNSIGQILYEQALRSTLTTVNIAGFAPGIYYFIFNSDDGKEVKKFVKL